MHNGVASAIARRGEKFGSEGSVIEFFRNRFTACKAGSYLQMRADVHHPSMGVFVGIVIHDVMGIWKNWTSSIMRRRCNISTGLETIRLWALVMIEKESSTRLQSWVAIDDNSELWEHMLVCLIRP